MITTKHRNSQSRNQASLENYHCPANDNDDDDDDHDEIAYFNVRWKLETSLVYSTKSRAKTVSRVETANCPISRGSQFGVSMVKDLWWKGFIQKVSLEFRVQGWMEKVEMREMGKGWEKHEEVKLVHKWSRKLVPEMRRGRGTEKLAISEFQRRGGGSWVDRQV